MINRIRLLISSFIVILSLFSLAGCDYINAISALMPAFDKNIPNIFSGCYAYYESDEDEEARRYTDLLEFDNIESTFTRNTAGESERKGTFTYSYNEFAITECNGYLTLNYEGGESVKYGFLYHASTIDGALTLTLRHDGSDYVYVYEY